MQPINSETFDKIAKAIKFLVQNHKLQPSLEDAADAAGLSPFHFQRVFTDWAGISPKKFVQYLTLENAKRILKEQKATLSYTADEIGLSGTSRLHDLFTTIEGMSPADFKNGGKHLHIQYQFTTTLFGEVIIASTAKGICNISFINDTITGYESLLERYPFAKIESCNSEWIDLVIQFFQTNHSSPDRQINLHINGTSFQLKVWQALLNIPSGTLQTYQQIAQNIGEPNASRAVGTAIGANPIAFLIPCHRVIKSTGIFGDYRWDANRKLAIIGNELSQNSSFGKPDNFSLF